MTVEHHHSTQNISGPALDEHSFQRIVKFAYETAGLSISSSKTAMVRTRLARRLRDLNFNSFCDYCDYFLSPGGTHERSELISALTTNVSHFFREQHHFDILAREVIPSLMQSDCSQKPIRFWSAGCSNGQEPLSLAITLRESGLASWAQDLKILATDIDPRVIRFAQASEYSERMMERVPHYLAEKYFSQVSQNMNHDLVWKSKSTILDLISYRRLNLLERWPMKGKFDVIFCRNVVIYFDQKTQDILWEKFANALRPGGWLFLGHSERISDSYQNKFSTFGTTAYRLQNEMYPSKRQN
ncbi:CheR family methyltransferase [Aliiroseovarius crassostreae]|uniref:CheR family methyltransferase n=1 Tax=Aliiroseovarius crassostreae TaxID=154981 RepID=UPI0021FC3948|nr:protein-glutamate O-methyltransferase CheR [Aliiroseovarius crassostreae]UWP97291.1 protein-glutamate O-methyltransferase CheR [Aliiroseovarius crassostreae]